jgi:D-alanyl-lipoteichoic acid acyltransferase DltB (MBOAT superfamily)
MSGLDSGSITFIAFGLIVVVLANIARAPAWRFAVLLGASILFILLMEARPLALLPLAGFLLAGYAGVEAARRGVPKAVTIGVLVLIGAYAWLKQYSFLPRDSFLHFPYLTLGLSYIFFRVLHLVIDAGDPGPARSVRPGHYLAYTLNFTTFISGPIQRYEDFAKQIDAPGIRPDLGVIGAQIERLVIGFFKINVLALLFNMVEVDALAELARPGGVEAKIWAALRLVGCYPFFLYCNFSGYIDIVIALARLMGLNLPENFDRPFSAASFIDFWNRWHITLSTWLKTYVYNPLLITLMRRFPSAIWEQTFGILCFFVTFFLIGIWHGRTSEYVFFGFLQGGGVAVNKAWQVALVRRMGRKPYRALAARPLYVAVARGLTFAWFAFSLIWFWASWSQVAVAYTGAGAAGWCAALLLLWVIATVLLAVWEAARARILNIRTGGAPLVAHPYARTVFIACLAAIAFLMTAVLSQPAPGIVYRTF